MLVSKLKKQKILNMYGGGIKIKMIAIKMDVDHRTINRIIKDNMSKDYMEKFGKLKIIEPNEAKDLYMDNLIIT